MCVASVALCAEFSQPALDKLHLKSLFCLNSYMALSKGGSFISSWLKITGKKFLAIAFTTESIKELGLLDYNSSIIYNEFVHHIFLAYVPLILLPSM